MSYFGHDVFGNPERVLDGGNDLRYRYDAAGRTTFVDEARGATLRPIKELRYVTMNQGADLRQGKLWRAIRHNYPDELYGGSAPDLRVIETYTFAGRRGRVSKRRTEIQSPERPRFERTFEQIFAYDQQGNINRVDYPVCLGAIAARVPASSATCSSSTSAGYSPACPAGPTSSTTRPPSGYAHA